MKQEKYIWTTKVNAKGQIVIPKQAREIFDIKSDDNLILFGDIKKGIAIAKYDDYVAFMDQVFENKIKKTNK